MAASKNDNNKSDNELLQPLLNRKLGDTGTWITGGYIHHEEYLPQLSWRRGIDAFDHMRRSDATIQGMLKVAKHPLLAATWDVEPASDEEFDQYAARFVKNELFNRNVNWYNFLRDVLGKLDFGFSVFEKTYEDTEFEGQFRKGLMELGWRKQWSVLRWETNEGDPGITQQLIGELVSIPQPKLLVFVNDREGDNYQGVSLLRYVYKAWDMKKSLENYAIVAAMRSLGFPVVEYNPDASKNDQKKMEDTLKNFRGHERQYMFYPLGKFKIDWMKIETNIKADLLPLIEHYQQEIDRSILAQFLDLAGSKSGGSGGSHALSEDHSQLFEKALEAVAKEIVEVLNGDLVQQLCDLNWSNMPNGYPKVTFSNIGDQNLDQMGKYFNALGQVDMMTPDPELENWLRQIAGAPDLPDDIAENYDQRQTAQSQALPLTVGGIAQNPNAPAPTGEVLQNPPTGKKPALGKKQPVDQRNAVTRTNNRKDGANKPVPVANGYTSPPKSATRASAATEDLRSYRQQLIAAVMDDASD